MKTLVILVCGDISVHRLWGTPRNYDLWISYYGDNPGTYREDADYYQESKGFKFPIIYDLVNARRAEIEQYDYICLTDDDILWSNVKLDRAFEMMKEYQIEIGQPAIEKNGTFYNVALLHPSWLPGRLVNFVEIMTPIFSKSALLKMHDTFNTNYSGWGVDWIWANTMKGERMACFDEVSVIHTRKQMRGEIYPNLKKAGIDPIAEIKKVREKYPFTNAYTLQKLTKL